MKNVIINRAANFRLPIILLMILIFVNSTAHSQKVIPLYKGVAPGSENWTWKEGETSNTPIKTRIIYNVTQPTLLAYFPDPAISTGAAVIIVTGGGGRVIMIDKEGIANAQALAKKGITAFVLKHRLAQSKTDDPWTEMMKSLKDTTMRDPVASQLGRDDLIAALKHVREHADEYKIDKSRVGLIGFSAGAVKTVNLIYKGDEKPDFAALNYGVYKNIKDWPAIKSSIPLFIAAATDDQLASVSNSIALYNHWITLKNSAELHIYAKGGIRIAGFPAHGLNEMPANTWIVRFIEWMDAMGLMKKTSL